MERAHDRQSVSLHGEQDPSEMSIAVSLISALEGWRDSGISSRAHCLGPNFSPTRPRLLPIAPETGNKSSVFKSQGAHLRNEP